MNKISPLFHYILHAILGGCLGFLASIIFWLIAIFQQFSVPVSASTRLWSAFYITAFIMIAILFIFYRKPILERLKEAFRQHDDLLD